MKEREAKLDNKGRLVARVGDRWRLAEERECWYCGDKFYQPIHYGFGEGKYCTLECASKERRKRYARQRVNKTCVICGNLYDVSPGRVKRRTTCGQPYCVKERQRQNTLRRHQESGQTVFQKVE